MELSSQIYTLSPSDFAFLCKDCPKCFWLKVKHGIQQPRSPMPSVFNVIDGSMKRRLNEVAISDFVAGAPNSRVYRHDGRVASATYQSPNGGPRIQIKGIYDTLLELEFGGFALVDLKTIKPNPKMASNYSMQLHAYAYALENPAIQENRLAPVSRLGLIAFGPERFTSRGDGCSALVGKNHWIAVERDDQAFIALLHEIAEMLASDTPPDSGRYCPTCQYIKRLKAAKYTPESTQSKFTRAL